MSDQPQPESFSDTLLGGDELTDADTILGDTSAPGRGRDDSPLSEGAKLGRFTVLRRVGAGGMGADPAADGHRASRAGGRGGCPETPTSSEALPLEMLEKPKPPRTPPDPEECTDPDEPATALGSHRSEVDAFELKRRERRLLAKMFGGIEEPTRLGRYVILDELGRGREGVVYAAHDPELDREVAVKRLRAGDPERRRRLVDRAWAATKLTHANVMPVCDIGEVDDAIFIVMEHIEGVTLQSWLATAPRSHAEILVAFSAAGRGLVAAHAAGVIHRDFKPDNVMLSDGGRVLVMDFGLARSGHGEDENDDEDKADAASDQLDFCAALYEALCREQPFVGGTLEPRRSPTERRELFEPPRDSAVPASLRRVVRRGLEATPEDRFESMQALLDALHLAASDEHERIDRGVTDPRDSEP